VREINLVAQDLTSYGSDRDNENLEELLKALDSDGAVDWIRLLYAYPVGVTESLLKTIVALPRVCNYLDVPLQHASERVLKAMRRPIGRFGSRRFVKWVKEVAPEIKIRTTFIVGFPGEREEDVAELEAFIREGDFESVGVFTFSPEEGTAAFEMGDNVSEEEKETRRERIMLAQQQVRMDTNSEYVGQELAILVEGTHEDTDLLLVGRAAFQAPEVDGSILINDVAGELKDISAGHIGLVEVTEVSGYDLVGKLVR
jgi:ribosomal protein S12 methylthiotransferase